MDPGTTSLRLLGGWCGAGENFVGSQMSIRWTTLGIHGGSGHCWRFNALACGGDVPCLTKQPHRFGVRWSGCNPKSRWKIPLETPKKHSWVFWLVLGHQYRRKGKALWLLTASWHTSKKHIHRMWRSNRKSGFSCTSMRHGWRCPGVLETLLQAQADANLVASSSIKTSVDVDLQLGHVDWKSHDITSSM